MERIFMLVLALFLLLGTEACSDGARRGVDSGISSDDAGRGVDSGTSDVGGADGGGSLDAGATGDADASIVRDGGGPSDGGADGGVPPSLLGGVDVDGDGRSDLVAASRGWLNLFREPLVDSTMRVTIEADPPSTNFGISVALLRDVNGDGLGDVAVQSVPGGDVFLYFGATAGIDAVPQPVIPGCGECMGEYVVPAGDVNADGLSDVLVQRRDGTSYGSAALHVGTHDGLAAGASRTWPNRRLLGGGDIDGDGDFDLWALDTTLHALLNDGEMVFEEVRVPVPAGFSFRAWVGDGDYNADGYADLAMVWGDTLLYLVPGGPAGPGTPTSVELSPGTGRYGDEALSFGDYDGDGFDDVLAVRATFSELGARFDLVFGGATPSAPEAFEDPMPDGSPTGSMTAYVGDLDGDGRGDFAYGTQRAEMQLLFGGERGAALRTLPMGLGLAGPMSAMGRSL